MFCRFSLGLERLLALGESFEFDLPHELRGRLRYRVLGRESRDAGRLLVLPKLVVALQVLEQLGHLGESCQWKREREREREIEKGKVRRLSEHPISNGDVRDWERNPFGITSMKSSVIH